MVAVLEMKPEASADRAFARRASMSRRARCASAWITSSTTTRRTNTWGFSASPHRGWLGASGNTSSASAARISPPRTSPWRSHSRENSCSTSRAASRLVTATASPAATGRLCVHSTPIR